MLLGICLALFLALSSGKPSAETPQLLSSFAVAFVPPLTRVPGHGASTSQTPAYTLRGTVLDSLANKPIQNALVLLYLDTERAVLTGSDGAFQFDGLLVSGQGSITAQKPGYFSPQDVRLAGHSSQTIATITMAPDQPPIVLKLVPEGIISGRVSGEDGEAIESLPVRVLFETAENGRIVRREFRNASTNEEGEFRIAELPPAKYFLTVGPGQAETPFPARRAHTEGYPAVFYSGASDLASASPIEIAPGAHAEINLSLSPEPFYVVSGTIGGYRPEEGVDLQLLNSEGEPIGSMSRFDPKKGTFQTQPVPPGSYTMNASAWDLKTQRGSFASRSVVLNADVSGVHLTLLPGLTIPVNVHAELTRDHSSENQGQTVTGVTRGIRFSVQIPPMARVVLVSKEGRSSLRTQYSSDQSANNGTEPLAISNVPPGDYLVEIYPNGAYYPHSARSGSTDLLREVLSVAPGASVQPIEIVLRDDFASLEGKISAPKVDSAVVLAIPEDAPQQLQPMIVNQPGGTYNLPQLRPGGYKVLALDQLEGLEYQNPEVLRKYLFKAHDVTLLPNQTATVDLEIVHLGE
jgi:hypothetical protein